MRYLLSLASCEFLQLKTIDNYSSFTIKSNSGHHLQFVRCFLCSQKRFLILLGLATTSGLAFMGLTSAQSEPILTVAEINSGMVFPVVAETFLGSLGIILMMVLMLFAIMSTGAGQVISIAALVIYDIYMPYVRPFHEDHKVRAWKGGLQRKDFHCPLS